MKIKKMYILLIVLAFLVVCVAGALGCFFYRNLHPLDERYQSQTLAAGFSEPPVLIDPEVVRRMGVGLKKARAEPTWGLHEWNALVRVIENKGTDWRC